MTMQDDIDIIERNIRRNMFQPKSQTAANKIDSQRPLGIAVAISTHNRDRRTDRANLIQNNFRANVAEVPDLVRLPRKIDNFLRQFVMSVREDEYPKGLSHLKQSRTTDTTGIKIANHRFRCEPLRPLCEALVSSCVIQ